MTTGSAATVAGRLSPRAPLTAFSLGGAVIAGLAATRSLQVLGQDQPSGTVVAGVLYLVMLAATQAVLCYLWSVGSLPPARAAGLLVIQAALVLIPLIRYTDWWLGLPGYFVASVLLVLAPVVSVPLALSITAGVGFLASMDQPAAAVFFNAVSTMLSALVLYGLTRLARLVVELHNARDDLARMAVASERTRFANRVQDLLVVRLSLIMSRARDASEQLASSPDHGRNVLGEVLSEAREALAEVRTVAGGVTDVSLTDELAMADATLSSAGIEVRIDDSAISATPRELSTDLARVLREAVANVIRHARPVWCSIVVRSTQEQLVLEVVNDGVHEDPSPPGPDSGLQTLARRLADAGGHLEVGLSAPDRFRVQAAAPLRSAYRAKDDPETRDLSDLVQMAPWLAAGILTAVFCGFSAMAFVGVVLTDDDGWHVAITAGCLLALLTLQIGYFSRPGAHLKAPLKYVALVAMAALVYLPLLLYREWWLDLIGFLVGSVLLSLPVRVAAPLAGFIVLTVGMANEAFGAPFNTPSWMVSVGTFGVVVFGLSRLVRLVRDLYAARDDLARMAVAEERLRFARDVHDLLGLSLSAVTLKAELANRLAPMDLNLARAELVEIVTLSRKAIGEVRSIADGRQDLQLAEELSLADTVLSSADIDVRISRCGAVPEPQSSVLAAVTREGVTNVLRHSKADRCEITVQLYDESVQLDVVNDGLALQHPAQSTGTVGIDHNDGAGNGIRNLTLRVIEMGGELSAGISQDGTYRLRAALPKRY